MISVIVPIYNSEKYLRQCINSLIRQTYEDIEVLLIDDGSKDGSSEICLEYTKNDKRIKYIYQENQGVSSARNTGLDNLSGEYVLFVDSDDWLPENAIELMCEKAATTEADLVIGSYTEIYSTHENSIVFNIESIKAKDEIAKYLGQSFLTAIASSPCVKLFRVSKISDLRFDRTMSLGEDLFFNLHYFRRIENVEIISDCCYYYRITDELSLTKSYKDNYYTAMREIYKYANNYFDEIEELYSCDVCREKVAYKLFSFAIAFAVRQVEQNYPKKSCLVYIKNLGRDSSFLDAIRNVGSCSFAERVIILLMKYKLYGLIYYGVRIRAKIR